MAEPITTVGDDMPVQQARCRELLRAYQDLGPAGTLGALVIEGALERADRAVMSGDIIRILACYRELKGLE